MNLKRAIWRCFGWLLLCAVVGLVMWTFKHSRGQIPALSFGGEPLNLVLRDDYNWQQRDQRWQHQLLAGHEQAGTLGEYGCTVSAIANAASNLGLVLTPQELNQTLIEHNGFNGHGWLVWGALEQASAGKLRARAFSSPRRADIDQCLRAGEYPIVKYLIAGMVQHWVTVVGKQDGHYLIRDPLIDKGQALRLSSRTPMILAVRCIGTQPDQAP